LRTKKVGKGVNGKCTGLVDKWYGATITKKAEGLKRWWNWPATTARLNKKNKKKVLTK